MRTLGGVETAKPAGMLLEDCKAEEHQPNAVSSLHHHTGGLVQRNYLPHYRERPGSNWRFMQHGLWGNMDYETNWRPKVFDSVHVSREAWDLADAGSTNIWHYAVRHSFFLPILILKIMHIKSTVMDSVGIPELDCSSLGLPKEDLLGLNQSRLLQQKMQFGLAFFVLWRNGFDWNHEMQFFQDINYVKGFQGVLLSNTESQLLCQLYSL